MKPVRVNDLAVGRSYRSAAGEVRKITRIRAHYGAMVLIDWERNADVRRFKGPAAGETTPQLFAKWAVEILQHSLDQDAKAAGQSPLFKEISR